MKDSINKTFSGHSTLINFFQIIGIALFIHCSSLKSNAQTKVDPDTLSFSVEMKKAEALLFQNTPKADSILSAQIVKLQNHPPSRIKTKIFELKLFCLRLKQDFQYMIRFGDSALTVAKEFGDSKRIASILVSRSVALAYTGQFKLAVKDIHLAMQLYAKAKDNRGIATAADNLAFIYSNARKHELELAVRKKYEAITLACEDSVLIGNVLMNTGATYGYLNQNDSALALMQRALPYINKTKRPDLFLTNQLNIADLLIKLNNVDEAEKILRKLGKNPALQPPSVMRFTWLINKMFIGMAHDRYTEAEKFGLEAFQLSKELNLVSHQFDLLQHLANIFHKLRKFEKEAEFLREINAYQDTLFSKEKQQELERLEVDHRIVLKEQKIKQQQEKINLQTKLNYAFISIGILLLLVLLIVGRNIKRKQAENRQLLKQKETLELLDAFKNKLFTIVSHDIRSPLSTQIGLMTLLEATASKEDREIIQKASFDLQSTLQWFDQLLYWVSSNLRNPELQRREESLSSLLENAIKSVKIQAEMKDIQIKNTLDNDISVFIDLQSVSSVIRNLINNAIKFSPDHSTIHIFLNNADDSVVRIGIQDEGKGMTQEQIARLFINPDTTSGEKGETGAGIGLILSQKLIEMQGGQLDVSSELGHGTIFYVSLLRKA